MMGGGVPTSIFKRQIGVGRDIFSDTSWDFKNVTGSIYLVHTTLSIHVLELELANNNEYSIVSFL